MEECKDAEVIKLLLNCAKLETIQLRKLTTTSFRIEFVYTFREDGGEE